MIALPEYSVTTLDTVHHCDALSLLRALPSASVSLIATDPPYGIGYASSWKTRLDGGARTTSQSFGEDKIQLDWLSEAARVLKDDGAMYLFTRWDVLHIWKQAIEAAGLSVAQRIVWYKAHWKMGDLRYYGSQTEDILFCIKGPHKLRWPKRSGNVWYSASALYQGDGYWEHPTQKPLKIIEKAILNSSDSGDVVFDCFIGSGTTAIAARNLGRHYIGCDTSREYVDIARNRLAQPYTLPMFAQETA